jgi:TRAP-type C4-dicarboxylate transport system permease small subunit
MPAVFNRVKWGTGKLVDLVIIAFFIIISLTGFGQIIMRWVFNNPLVWAEELIRLMYVWICYLGWTLATRNKSHIRITGIIERFPPQGKKLIETLNSLLVIMFSLFMIWFGIKATEVGNLSKAVTFPISFALVYVVAPIANCVILFYHVLEIINLWKGPETKEGVL